MQDTLATPAPLVKSKLWVCWSPMWMVIHILRGVHRDCFWRDRVLYSFWVLIAYSLLFILGLNCIGFYVLVSGSWFCRFSYLLESSIVHLYCFVIIGESFNIFTVSQVCLNIMFSDIISLLFCFQRFLYILLVLFSALMFIQGYACMGCVFIMEYRYWFVQCLVYVLFTEWLCFIV